MISNFKDFTKDYNIRIPLIQRDYVQGLDANRQKRDAFLEALLSALADGKSLSLDFIYGTTIALDKADGKKVFEPLDGQQRLTTLCLLALLLSKRSPVVAAEGVFDSLRKFSYMTRISSTQFCKRLFGDDEPFPTENISEFIEQRSWYLKEWDYDPTVKAMKEMMDKISEMLNSEAYSDKIDTIAANLYGEENKSECVVFDKLDMGEYGLTDDLYIKMNARGKQLTDFENWKASFIKFLVKQFPESGYKERFEDSIEHEWTDMLWTYVYKEWNSKNEEEKKDTPYPVIDNAFMRLFNYLFRMLYFSNVDKVDGREVQAADFVPTSSKVQNEIFGKAENVEYLFNALDFFSRIKPEQFFSQMFFVGHEDFGEPECDWEVNKGIRLFGSADVNLFLTCIKEGENMPVKEQLLLYCIIKYGVKYEVYDVNEELFNYVRTCRNLIESINQRLAKDVTIVSNVRLVDFKKYDAAIDVLISQPDIKDVLSTLTDVDKLSFGNIQGEKDKVDSGVYDDINIAFVENLSFLRGNLSIFKQEALHDSINLIHALKAFNTMADLTKIQLLVSFGFEGEQFGYCGHGMRTFFGKEGDWDIVFTSTKKETVGAVNAFVEWYSKQENQEKHIEEAVLAEHNFRYYALKYPEFLNARLPWDNRYPTYYFSVNGDLDDLDLIAFGSYSSTPLRSYHTEPFASTVYYKLIGKNHALKEQFGIDSIYSSKASLYLRKYGCYLGMAGDKWVISYDDGVAALPQSLLEKFSVKDNQLYEQAGGDLVTTASEFVETLYRDYPKK